MNLDRPDLSIIIPARQEALRLPKTLHLLQKFLNEQSYSAEIIPVVQGEDETTTIIINAATTDPRIRPIFDPTGRGKGLAVRQGVKAAQGNIILFMDADLSVPLSCLQLLIKNFIQSPHDDLLIGSRHLPDSNILIPQPFLRQMLGKIFNLALRLSDLTHFRDTQCGCKLFRHDAAKKIFAQSTLNGFAFDVEILLLAQHLGYQIKEVPVEWANAGNSRLGLLRDGFRAIQDIWELKRKFTGRKENLSLN
ncbi:MAG: hypothetical protein A3F67_02220 [Verrucomicrobia bacterium RIFCSPHIGHO2_12_FULL_41_10]|nr:MAG: hypothetical protein A3F67_02220 [Verrucomicrobia bacterium RIFCSPHIGHO2_12_FULL_41_10]HLB33968.1 dolichyl-phosphate beta-glucosyltransferase [Chthoniobacterales bacterium]